MAGETPTPAWAGASCRTGTRRAHPERPVLAFRGSLRTCLPRKPYESLRPGDFALGEQSPLPKWWRSSRRALRPVSRRVYTCLHFSQYLARNSSILTGSAGAAVAPKGLTTMDLAVGPKRSPLACTPRRASGRISTRRAGLAGRACPAAKLPLVISAPASGRASPALRAGMHL